MAKTVDQQIAVTRTIQADLSAPGLHALFRHIYQLLDSEGPVCVWVVYDQTVGRAGKEIKQ